MFVRFRRARSRLHCSLIKTRRSGATVRHDHVAGLGGVAAEPSIADRVVFWAALHRRFAALADRVGDAERFKAIEAIHSRIAMPTPDEIRRLQKENAEADRRFWVALEEINAARAVAQRQLATIAEHGARQAEGRASDAAARAAGARERIASIARDEPAAGARPVVPPSRGSRRAKLKFKRQLEWTGR